MSIESADALKIKTNALTFGLVAKHLLSKSVVESISSILEDLLNGLIEPQDMIKSIGYILKDYHAVNKVWQALIDRQSIRMSPLYNDLNQIIRRFLECGVPEYYIISFLSTIINSTRHNVRRVDLITLILSYKFLRKYRDISITYLLVCGLKIASRIKPNPQFDKIPKVFNVRDLIEHEEELPPPPPSIRYRLKDKNEQYSHEYESDDEENMLGYSYQKTEYFINKLPSTFFLNTYAKSTRVGSEGGDSGKMSDVERFYSYVKWYAFSMFESFVVADISYYAQSHFALNSKIIKYNAITDLYLHESPTILKFVKKYGNTSIVESRAHENMLKFSMYRKRTEEKVQMFSDVFPIFDERPFIKFSQKSEPVVINFDISRNDICFIMSEICMNNLKVLYNFINNVLPHFTLLRDEYAIFIVNENLANALYYFARACDEMEFILSKTNDSESSVLAIIEAAGYEVESKYINVVKSDQAVFLESFLNKFMHNGDDFYNMVDEAINRFGSKTDTFFKMFSDIEKLTAIVNKFMVEVHSKAFISVAKMLGRASGQNAKERLNARIPLMMKKLSQAGLINSLIKIEMDGKAKTVVISNISI